MPMPHQMLSDPMVHERPQADAPHRESIPEKAYPRAGSDKSQKPHWLPLLVLWLAWTGCLMPSPQEDPSRFYLLESPPRKETAKRANPPTPVAVELTHVVLPSYLQRPGIVIRHGDPGYRIEPQSYHRWGEPLEANLARLFRHRLLSHPHIGSVTQTQSFTPSPPDFDVTISITACEGIRNPTEGDAVRLAARWRIRSHDPQGDPSVSRGAFDQTRPWDGSDFSALVAGLSEAGSALADAIARNINSH